MTGQLRQVSKLNQGIADAASTVALLDFTNLKFSVLSVSNDAVRDLRAIAEEPNKASTLDEAMDIANTIGPTTSIYDVLPSA